VNPGFHSSPPSGADPEHAAQLLITAGGNPDRLRSEAAFAALCAASPFPAGSGKTNCHRLNPAGDRDANRALYMILVTRRRYCPETQAYVQRRFTKDSRSPKRSAASSGMSLAGSTATTA